MPVTAPVTSVVSVYAPLLAVKNAPSAALPSRVTLAATAAISRSLVRAATTVVTAVASASRALTRSFSPNRPNSESWVPSSPIHPLVWASAPFLSSLDTLPVAPRALSSSTASRAFTSPVTQLISLSADFARAPSVIIPADSAVAIVIELTTYKVIGYGGFTLSFARRLVVVDGTGVLADWRDNATLPPSSSTTIRSMRRTPK